MHEKELIEQIKRNDEQAFTKLINTNKEQVLRIAMGFVHDKSLAEDIVQDVFIKFWEIREDFELTAKFSTWLYRVTINMSLNVVRKAKFSRVFSSFSGKYNDEGNKTSYESVINDESQKSVDEVFKQEHIKIALKNAIDSLPKKQKTAFILSKYQDFSYKEISEIMELSISSIESLLHRAKTNLQKKLFNVYKNL